MTIRQRWPLITLLLILLLAATGWLARKPLLEHLLHKVLVSQSLAAFEQQMQLQSLSMDGDKGHIYIQKLSFTRLQDPQQLQHFTAPQVQLNMSLSGLLSPHVRVHQALIKDAEIVLEFIAPGVSNLSMLEQSYRTFAHQRKAERKTPLLEWDLEQITFQNLHFRLLDYGGHQLADVQIPKIQLDSLASSNSAEENLRQALKQIQLSLLSQLIQGQLEGEYDKAGIAQLLARELPNSRLLSNEQLNKAKNVGRSLIERWLQ